MIQLSETSLVFPCELTGPGTRGTRQGRFTYPDGDVYDGVVVSVGDTCHGF